VTQYSHIKASNAGKMVQRVYLHQYP